MSNGFANVSSGQPLRISASVWNEVLDALKFIRQLRNRTGRPGSSGGYDESGVVDVKNNSDTNRVTGEVLGIDTVWPTPTNNLNAFRSGNIIVHGVTPTAVHAGRFVVLLEPIAAGKIGKGCVWGECAAKVNVSTAGGKYADAVANDATGLALRESGSAEVLYIEDGTGSKWAWVRIGPRAGKIKVKLTANLDAEGSATGQPQKRDLAQKKWVDDTAQAEITVYDMDGSHFGLKGECIDAELAGIDDEGNPIYEAVSSGEPTHDVTLSGTLSPGDTANATWGEATLSVTGKWISTGKTLSGDIGVFYDKLAKQWKPMIGSGC